MTNKSLQHFITTIKNISTEKDLLTFFEGILTPEEIKEIPQRLEIVRRLQQGIPQRTIANDLKVGIATVTRGSKEVQKGLFNQIKELQ